MRGSHDVGSTAVERWIHALHSEELAPLWMAWSILRGAVKTSLTSGMEQRKPL